MERNASCATHRSILGVGVCLWGGGAVDMLYVQEMKWVRSMNSFKGLGGMSDKKTSFMVSRYFA